MAVRKQRQVRPCARGLRALAAEVIADAFRLGFLDKSQTAGSRRHPEQLKASARDWLLRPTSNLDVFAGMLGHSQDYYRRKARELAT
jgi:hypothetical protein